MPRKERHVLPNSDRGGWDSKRENAERVSKHFETKKVAMDWSREKAKREKSELIPHGKDVDELLWKKLPDWMTDKQRLIICFLN